MQKAIGRLNPGHTFGLAAIAILVMAAAAAPPAAPRIGVVDSKRIAAESATIRAMITEAKSKAETLQGELEKLRADMNARLEAYSAQRSVVSREEKARREEAIQGLKDEIEILEIRLGREVKRSQEGMVGPMGVKILAAVREVAADEKLAMTFSSDDLIHYDAACDITQKVIAKLDAKAGAKSEK